VAVRAADVSANDIAPDGRVFALILDDQLTQPFRTLSVRRLAREFVEQHVGPSDLVAVFSTGGRGALTQEFTTDHARVLAAIDRFQGNRIRRGPETDPERVFGIETAMDAIAALADHLKGIRGRRVAAVYISEGIDYNIYQAMRPSAIPGNLSPADVAALLGARGERSTGATEDRERQATPVIRAIQRAMEQLSRANVVLYGVDPRGLYSPDGEWLEFNPRDKTDVEPPTREEHARSIESLRVVSESTGGFALVNTNDFGDLFRRVVAESSHYYVLGYSPSRPGQSGQYRRITVRVRPGLRVAAREGYIVPARRPAAPPVRAVLAALDDSLPLPHLPLRVQAIPLPPVAAGATTRPVQVIVEIDGEGLTFREENGRFTERIELAVKTLDGLAREANRAATEMALPPLSSAQRDRIVGAGIRWLTTVALAPGAHSLRVAAQATTAGRTGSVFVDVDVPAIGDEGVRLTDLALTATSAADTPTGGTPAIVAPLPTPPTTRRTFRVGETITVGTTVESSLSSAPVTITAMVHRITEDAELLVTSAAPPVVRPEGDAAHVIFSLPTAGFAPSRYVIGLGQPAAGDALREVVVELRP
jgi:VWFA-related protein